MKKLGAGGSKFLPAAVRGGARLYGWAEGEVAAAKNALQPAPPIRKKDRRIRLTNIVKEYHTPIGQRRVLDNVSFDVNPGEKVAVLGRNGAGKSTLVKIIGGVEPPTSGEVHKGLYMSWPLAFAGGLDGVMTGMDNIKFIARVYNRSFEDIVAFVDDFAELGRQLFIPVRNYSSGMNMRLAFGLTLAIDFECFLIDEILSVGDQRFHQKCFDELFVKRADRAMILVSHDIAILKKFCDRAVILKGGRSRVFDDIDFALSIYHSL